MRSSIVCVAALLMLGRATTGPCAALRQGHTRTQLASDSALSVFVGIQATWQSLVTPGLPSTSDEKGADVSEYGLTDTPTVDNLMDHSLVLTPPSSSENWYVFRPTGDTFHLTFDIADTSHRLGRLEVKDLETGQVLGSVNASPDGASIVGQIEVPWGQPYYRVDGYNRSGGSLFLLGASHGRPDTYVHFKQVGQFAPYRPASLASARLTQVGDNVSGVQGDPYSAEGLKVSKPAEAFFSRGCCAKDQQNDAPVQNPMNPPTPYLDYIQKRCIETASATGFPSNTRADQPSLAEDILSVSQEAQARALTDVTMLPYSDTTGHWHAKFLGGVTAFFVVPYSVAKNSTILNAIKAVFDTLVVTLSDNWAKLWPALIAKYAAWRGTPEGVASNLKAGMVQGVGDVKMVTCQEDLKATPYVLPLLQEVTFQLVPNPAPGSGTGIGAVTRTGTLLNPPPPLAAGSYNLTFSSASNPPWTTKLSMEKGWNWNANAGISSPPGWQAVNQPVALTVPPTTTVVLNCSLGILLELRVYTQNAQGAPASESVVVKNAAGATIWSGMSTSTGDGRYAAHCTIGLAPAHYRVEVTRLFPPGGTPGVREIDVTPALLREETVNADS